jgi:hypothetical protein
MSKDEFDLRMEQKVHSCCHWSRIESRDKLDRVSLQRMNGVEHNLWCPHNVGYRNQTKHFGAQMLNFCNEAATNGLNTVTANCDELSSRRYHFYCNDFISLCIDPSSQRGLCYIQLSVKIGKVKKIKFTKAFDLKVGQTFMHSPNNYYLYST